MEKCNLCDKENPKFITCQGCGHKCCEYCRVEDGNKLVYLYRRNYGCDLNWFCEPCGEKYEKDIRDL